MVPDSVIQKMTEQEKLDYMASLQEDMKLIIEKNELIDKLSIENQKLRAEVEMLKSSNPANQMQKMNELADFIVENKELVLENCGNNNFAKKLIQIGMDSDLDDESFKAIVLNALSLLNKYSLMNKIKGTESEDNIIIP